MERKDFKELFEESKEKLDEKIDSMLPNIEAVFINDHGELDYNQVDKCAHYIARHCSGFNSKEKFFVKSFIRTSIIYLYYFCPPEDFKIDSIHKLINTVSDYKEILDDKITTFEILIESKLDSKELTDEEKLIFRKCVYCMNYNYINCKFNEVVHAQVEEWTDNFLHSHVKDKHYEKAYKYCESLLNKKSYLNAHKYLINEQKVFEVDRVFQRNFNPHHSYETYRRFEGQLIEFKSSPISGRSAEWVWLNNDDIDNWITSTVVSVHSNEDRLSIETKNTIYILKAVNY